MTTFEIDVQNPHGYALNEARLKQAAALVLTRHAVDPGSGVSVVITGDETVQTLNRQYRGIDMPTDILSFPADTPPVDGGEPPYLGDLIIAYPYTASQAERERHPLDDSLTLLAVHGILHLLGYDHNTPENRALMWSAQEDALRALGISVDIVPAMEGDTHGNTA